MRVKIIVASLFAVFALTGCVGTRPTELPPAPASSFTVSVRGGESLSAVASRYQVKEDDLLALNKISDRKSLKAGRIRIPAYGRDREPLPGTAASETSRITSRVGTPAARTATASATRVESRQLAPPPNTRSTQVASNGSRPGHSPEAVAQQQPSNTSQPGWWSDWFGPAQTQPVSAVAGPHETFLWPISGRVISNFGQNMDGGRNDGINISARLGTPIRAADAGTVSYVGNELKGYGNLVLIRHDNGYVTAYAHAERIDVQRGDRVARGQVIGSTGDTGDVLEPQLHFELRLGTRPVDPTPYLVASK
jgi:murein DD-endopeptidase MepM/ murein hydrolase activator NlpD